MLRIFKLPGDTGHFKLSGDTGHFKLPGDTCVALSEASTYVLGCNQRGSVSYSTYI